MGEVYDLKRSRKLLRKQEKFPLPESLLTVVRSIGHIFGMSLPIYFEFFRLRTHKLGVQVYIIGDNGCEIEITSIFGITLKNFKQARSWVNAISIRYNLNIQEKIRKVMPRPKGYDRMLLKQGGCKEAWLSSDIPNLYAEAMMRCHNASGECSYKGFCVFRDCNMIMENKPDLIEEAVI